MHAGHGGRDVGGDVLSQEGSEEGVGLGLGARGVEDGGQKHVDALDVGGLFDERWRLALLGVVNAPCGGIENAGQGGVGHAAFEESVGRERAEDIVADLLV